MRSLEAGIEIRATPEAVFDLIHDYGRQLETPEPLRTPSDNNKVCLTPEPPFSLNLDRWAFEGPKGMRIVPRVAVSGAGDSKLELTNLSSYGEDLCFGASVGARLGGPFDGVRIWSAEPLMVGRVEWRSTHK
jgi:hypothetical protein